MTKELLQHTWWALVRGSRGPPGGPQGGRAPQFGKHRIRVSTELNEWSMMSYFHCNSLV